MYKVFAKRLLYTLITILVSIISINIIVDPISLYKESFQLQHIENKAYPEFVALKLYSDFDTAIIGTSRSQVIDHRYLKKYNINAKNLSIAGSSININYELVKKAKALNKNVILFLDPYTLDINHNNNSPKKIKKLNIIQNEIIKLDGDKLYYYLKYLFSGKTLRLSLSTLFYTLKDLQRDYRYIKDNNKNRYIKGEAIMNIKNSTFFNNYHIDKTLVHKSISLLSKKDFIIIPPLIHEHYLELYSCGALEKYFSIIKLLLEKDVNIISFLYPSDDLLNYNLFDNSGSHFKHYYGNKIIDDIYSKQQKISLKLTSNNFNDYKESIINWLIKQKEPNAI